MQSSALCHAAADRESASELASYLQLNCPAIAFDLEEFTRPGSLLDAAGRALSADFPILLLSPAAVPQPWPRTAWEPILVEEAGSFERQIAYVLLRPCKFPEVLRRGVFFDLSQGTLEGRRALKRWLLRQNAFFTPVVDLPPSHLPETPDSGALEQLQCRLSDRPGIETNVSRDLALAFAHTAAPDFEGIFWLNCADRSFAGILGHTAHLLGLRLRGPVEENACAIQEFCRKHRILFVVEHSPPECEDWATAPGRASFLFVAGHALPPPRSLAETMVCFASWQRDSGRCLGALGDAHYHLRNLADYNGDRWQTALSLSAAACSLLEHTGRLAEAYEFLEMTIAALRAKGDPFKAAQLEWKKSWILEEWGQPVPGTPRLEPASPAAQLTLFN